MYKFLIGGTLIEKEGKMKTKGGRVEEEKKAPVDQADRDFS